ncbi:hypothetical protein ABF80_15010 [Enterobacter hormaechei subsp. steigerwaltii]|uniref:DUF4062 domain-containing protein n=2 Tax=Enterobacteriaceae TaxID=543 RepID=UPI00064976DB|nr:MULTISPECIES: DUF4062 domain-containing protein [Enterobacter]AYA12539.1 DUF4062 domain-containing protein [Enterobacter cloacae]MBT1829311.1 DUF4062 domain-containing protein [Enterobacter hormaechei subsp. xiangfangensis]HDC4411347.1 DUF4062 domain-containing protein [Enterobacter kobei]ELJ5764853.1 DUF4062 domain-containing protein [Enterobacter hormaechei]ELT6633870.1 DUF4062 domain-containing protein [Enterobacter hormaechei]
MDKRYQVFVSSTFTDLEEERKHVIQTLMEMDCIPAGMELFPAIDEGQWEFIKKVIDDCDYYLLIIGGRYGSVAEDGLSYTEKEFDYAVSKGLRVVVLVHENPENLPLAKSEKDSELREKLAAFIEKASTNRLRKTWATAKDLPGLVALSMSKTMKTYPAIGWVRANLTSSETDLRAMVDLQKENEWLKSELAKATSNLSQTLDLDLADFDDDFEFRCESTFPRIGYDPGGTKHWSVKMKWKDIFHSISPYLTQYYTESSVSYTIAKSAQKVADKGGTSAKVSSQDLKTIGVQFRAYGLIKIEYLKTTNGSMNTFWSLTEAGQIEMLKTRTIKKQSQVTSE